MKIDETGCAEKKLKLSTDTLYTYYSYVYTNTGDLCTVLAIIY